MERSSFVNKMITFALMAISDNGYISSFLYDASGERVVKSHGGNLGVSVNGVFSGGITETSRYTAYVSPYLVVNQSGKYTKHVYVGDQRVVSKLGDMATFLQNPNTTDCAGIGVNPIQQVDYDGKYAASLQTIEDNYAHFEEIYRGTDNNPYIAGRACSCDSRLSTPAAAPANNPLPESESLQFFYHSDHLGSTTLTTDVIGGISQRIEYTPFGEVFVEERNNTWNTPLLFNVKELDEETGLYYYGARYYDPRTSLWLSVDPLAEKYPGVSPYAYCLNNPVRLVDPDGRDHYQLDREGYISFHRKTDNDSHTLYATNKKGIIINSFYDLN